MAEVEAEPGVGTEGQRPHPGMHAVGADQQVDDLARPVAEVHLDSGGVLADGVDGDTKPDRHLAADLLVQHGLEVAAEEVEVPAGEQPATNRRIGQTETSPAFAVDEHQLGDGAVNGFQPRQQAQPLGGIVAGPEEVDHVALAAWSGRQLDQQRLPAQPPQAQRDGQAGDAGADDQRPLGHRLLRRPSLPCPSLHTATDRR
jgi:hypothetical protein